MKIGGHVKVHLPGEAPWAIVTAILPDGRVMARIDNHTCGDLHDYKYGDVATFRAEFDAWRLAPAAEQERVGPRRVSQ